MLVAEAGKFGERWAEIAATRGLDVAILSAPWGSAIAPERVTDALDADPSIRGVLIQLSETSTGVQHPVREIAEQTRNRDVMLVADGISSVGIAPTPMDEWGVDCLITGSQKGLMVPPGLSLLAFSAQGLEAGRRRRSFLLLFQSAQGKGYAAEQESDDVHLAGQSDHRAA